MNVVYALYTFGYAARDPNEMYVHVVQYCITTPKETARRIDDELIVSKQKECGERNSTAYKYSI